MSDMPVLSSNLFQWNAATRSMDAEFSELQHGGHLERITTPMKIGVRSEKTGTVKTFTCSDAKWLDNDPICWPFYEDDADADKAVTVVIFND